MWEVFGNVTVKFVDFRKGLVNPWKCLGNGWSPLASKEFWPPSKILYLRWQLVVLECLHTSFKYLCCNLTFCFKFTLLFQICNGVRLQGQIQKIQKERAEYGSLVWTDCCYRLQKHVENKKKKGGHGSLSPSPKSAPGMLIESTFHFSQSESKRSIFLVYNWQWNSNIPVALGQKILNFH